MSILPVYKRSYPIAIAISMLFAASSFALDSSKSDSQALPEVSTNRIKDMPDMTQTDKRASLPNKGKMYCGPVAVSNSLIWLARHGYPSLASGYDGSVKSQGQIARLIGERFMQTQSDGTNVSELMLGTYRYLNSKGCPPKYFAYQGWRKHPKSFSTGVKVPRLSFIKRASLGRAVGWLNIGWYRFDRARNAFIRKGGHWLTVAGYGMNARGENDKKAVVVFDPAARNGRSKAPNYIELSTLVSGKLVNKAFSQSARGFYYIKSGMKLKKTAEYGIIDGVVLVVL